MKLVAAQTAPPTLPCPLIVSIQAVGMFGLSMLLHRLLPVCMVQASKSVQAPNEAEVCSQPQQLCVTLLAFLTRAAELVAQQAAGHMGAELRYQQSLLSVHDQHGSGTQDG